MADDNKREKVKVKARETYEASKEYTAEQKQQILDRYHKEVNDLGQKIDELKANLKTKSEEAKIKLNAQISTLEKERADLNVKLGKLSTASNSAWKEMKSGVESAFKEIKTSFNKASAEFKKEK